jgi:AcrR family transcriptional regulator
MNVAARKLRQKEELRAQILKAARKIVTDEGFAALTMRRLASDIEYATGTIYLYFASRDELAMELCREGFRVLLSHMEPVASIVNPVERLRAGLHAYARYALENPAMYRMTFMDPPKFAQSALEETPIENPGESGMQAFGFLVQSFDQLRAKGRLSTRLPSQQLAEIFWASAHGIVSLKITYPAFPTLPAQGLLFLSLDCLLEGILRPEEGLPDVRKGNRE